MATQSGRTRPPLIEQLINDPWKFDFFQAVRLVEQCTAERMLYDGGTPVHAVGHDDPPDKELLRFRALASHTFPSGEIASISPLVADDDADRLLRFEMVVPFFGLTGPSGVLPHHYTQLLIDRIRLHDFALRDFLDIFNHRLTSLFYRAWEKYRFSVGYEKKSWQVRTQELHEPVREDARIALFEHCLYALIGMGTPGLRNRLEPGDEAFLYYGGLFAHRPRNASSLQRMLEDYFELPVTVQQFQGQWLYLDPPDQSSLPSREVLHGLNARLGVDTLVGERVWSVQDKFRVRIGPLDYGSFCRFMPTGDRLTPLAQLTRMYVGPEFDFDVQPVLRASDVPPTQFAAEEPRIPRLGWNTWLLSRPTLEDRDDAVFASEGNPTRS